MPRQPTCERLVEAWPRPGYAATVFRRCGKPADFIHPNGKFLCADCAKEEGL